MAYTRARADDVKAVPSAPPKTRGRGAAGKTSREQSASVSGQAERGEPISLIELISGNPPMMMGGTGLEMPIRLQMFKPLGRSTLKRDCRELRNPAGQRLTSSDDEA